MQNFQNREKFRWQSSARIWEERKSLRNFQLWIWGLCLLLLAGCANKDVAVLNPAAVRPAKPPGSPIELFLDDSKPTRPYTQVAVTQVAGDANDLRENIEDLQDKARMLGADAVIVKNIGTVADRSPFRTTYQTTKEGMIIVYK